MNDPDQTATFEQKVAAAPSPLPTGVGRYRIEKELGRGGFGLVYLGRDDQLERFVAIKVPHGKRLDRPETAEAYRAEARTVAGLDHPNIVPVYDVGSTEDFPFFIVSKFIDGADLAARLKRSRLALNDAVELVATVAEALHYAHLRGLVHRDIKPGNLLIEQSGKVYVGDFGLALRDRDLGQGPRYAGTPAYMSPEQARGEGHRVDGRSDIFSLGAVFYELLVGRPPFRADTKSDLMEQVTSHDPRPPRQFDEAIPKEPERICLKAMSKRASERYSTAKDLADDLRHFLAERQRTVTDSIPATPLPYSAPETTRPNTTPATPSSDNRPIKIVPKGLRSFDAHDANFFLELLPGPRDRDGLPDSLRFWKARIEEKDADATFPVGLIYGPSGCGKSSLVKAGLLPVLSEDVIALYVETTGEETETRLLNGLRKKCISLPENLDLKATLTALRRGQGLPAGKKVLIVLDQFEQWLHAKKDQTNSELVQALRQCDGGRVQCLVLVRDDFWLAVSRFLRELEIRLVEGQNSALADLFDSEHARKVLVAFGRAFGKLPEQSGEIGRDQKLFLDQAVAGLAEEGKIVCVRLALFAEMMKGKAWTPNELKAVGGTAGVGVAFLEETFGASTAPPERRYHQVAARRVLKALLPESGTDIKGHMRSHAELLEASGYAGRRNDFEDLIRILDGEIRLITPTDPEGVVGDGEPGGVSPRIPGDRYYQLTHDYLVPSLRDWLTRKQKETRRGRAELLLADRAAIWGARPENRQLPSFLQWMSFRSLTTKKNWTPPQSAMMAKAGKVHAARGAILAACLAFLGWLTWEGNGRFQAHSLRDRVLEASTADTPAIIRSMAPYRGWINPLLHEAKDRAEKENDPRKQLHASLALLPVDAGQKNYLYERMLNGDPQEVVAIRDALESRKGELTEPLWTLLENPKNEQDQRFRAACALASYDPGSSRWSNSSDDVAATLVIQKPFALADWTKAFSGVGPSLIPPLAEFLVDEKRGLAERGVIASVYGTLAADAPDAYARLESELPSILPADAAEEAKIKLAKRQASIGVALLVMGKGEKVWPLLKLTPDPTLRSFLIDRFASGGVDPKMLIARLLEEKDVSIRRAILIGLGEYGLDRVSLTERRIHLPWLLELYRSNPDPGIHSAAEWVLRQWGAEEEIDRIDRGLPRGKAEGERSWYLNRQGQAFAVIPPPGEFRINEGERRHRRRIDHAFAVATKEVTTEQFLQFRPRHEYNNWFAPSRDCPALFVTWYDAAAYCNWLSDKEGIPKDQWCYAPNKEGKYAVGMTTAPDYLKRTGYRLPTEAEWHFANRAGAETDYAFGRAVELLGKYGWFDGTSLGISHPVGTRRPNDFGLFDSHGNAWEWCQDLYREKPKPNDDGVVPESGAGPVEEQIFRVVLGGSFNNPPTVTRTANTNKFLPGTVDNAAGFRVFRTMPGNGK